MHDRITRAGFALIITGLLTLTACAPEGTEAPDTLQPGEVGGGTTEPTNPATTPPTSPPASDGDEPQPGEKQPGAVATDTREELGEIEGRQPVEVEKHTTLPASFPRTAVPIPDDARIDNAGERSDGSWFVVLRSTSVEATDALVQTIAEDGGFTVQEHSPLTASGFERTLTRDTVSVYALGYVDDRGPVVSLDITVAP